MSQEVIAVQNLAPYRRNAAARLRDSMSDWFDRLLPDRMDRAEVTGLPSVFSWGMPAMDVVEAATAEHQLTQDDRGPALGEYFRCNRHRAKLTVYAFHEQVP